jgi:hypothetical protein
MRRFFAISLTSLFLFSALVPVQAKEELAKLPELIEHFREHKAETPGLTFLQFIELHYGEKFAQHRSAHDHSQLPMKTVHDHVHAPAVVMLPMPAWSAPAPPAQLADQPIFADQSYSFILLHDIWQPPRAC